LQGLLKKPRPKNLITVPACAKCNASFAGDDEYFLNIAMDIQAAETPDGAAVVEKRLRSMKRQEDRAKWKPVFETMVPVELRSKSGFYLDWTIAYRIDANRLMKTVNRMIRGLYYEVAKSPLPVDVHVGSLPLAEYMKRHGKSPEAIERIKHIPSLPSRMLGDGTFEARYFLIDGERHRSFWYLEFFRRLGFVGSTSTAPLTI